MKNIDAASAGALTLALLLSGPAIGAEGDQDGIAYTSPPGVSPGFNQLDVSRDGKLSKAEAAGRKGLLDEWRQADQNGDDMIERSEFSAFERHGPWLAPGQMKETMR